MLNKKIKSPLDLSGDALLKEIIDTDKVINAYQTQFDIDVTKYLRKIKKIGIYECINTKYRFYYPFDIDGDGKFYEKLEHFDWYYMSWKWENEVTLKFLKEGDKILEVGSGGLGFLEKLNKKGYNITGLELNEESVIKGKQKGLKVLNETIEEYARQNKNKYDIVCSYQVLEHIAEVESFIKAQVDCLKINGKLIISVPNNEAFLRYDRGGLLNHPPHHMGLWGTKSLLNIVNLFNIKKENVFYEPLQIYHIDWYVNILINRLKKHYFFYRVFKKLKLKKLLLIIVKLFRKSIHGHTIMVIYKKIK